MNRSFLAVLTLLVLSCVASAQTATAPASGKSDDKMAMKSQDKMAAAKPKRGPIFRATKEQINQAQAMLKQRNFYAGEPTGKLDDATRAGLRKFQDAEKMKVTGTLNRATLEKMNIALTDKQKAMPAPTT